MSRLMIVLTAMTVDGVMTVEERFVPEGDHMEASLRLFEGDTALLYGRKNYEGSPPTGWRRKESGRTPLNPCRNSSLAAAGAADLERDAAERRARGRGGS